ncbi:hypothetical protein DOS84_18760 [Flavobacterium aquariorum]|uniref:Uncharacterized protein n=1 Tax=Flavobacterium aquariorum TaxID=2217670 RepID=A0A2W7TRC5_9FLAO|nr:hypothetical protein [Flavobacterium aquariorum]PZX91846.1 hypothetical protein DOS84_18760 [Flavobacterium aquariorum]
MAETIISSLTLALITGITVLAFKYKIVFDKIFDKISILVSIIFILLFTWSSAVENTYIKINQFIDYNKIKMAKESLPDLNLESHYLILIFVIVQVYLNVIKYITNVINNQDDNQPENKVS